MLTVAIPFCALTMHVPAFAQTSTATKIAVPTGSLDRALMAIGRQSGVQISYQSDLTGNARRVEGFSDAIDAESALRRVLHGSGLSHHFTDRNTVLIQRSAQVSRASYDGEASVSYTHLTLPTNREV